MPISVLYIHHYGAFGGASRSLLEMVRAFPSNSVIVYLITQRGPVAEIFKKQGVSVIETFGISQFNNMQIGYYRKLRWLILLRELCYIFPTLFAIIRARLKWRNIDIVHINGVTMPLPVVFSSLIFRKPVVVHCRGLQRKKKNLRYRLIKFILNHFSDITIAIDLNVKDTLSNDLNVKVIHNGFWPEYSPKEWNFDFSKRSLNVGIVGNLLPIKGIYEFVEAAKLCVEKGHDINFIIVGDNPFEKKGIKGLLLSKLGFRFDVRTDIKNFIQQYGLKDYIHLLGFELNLKKVYKNIDVLCFPSHIAGAGRPVFEAAFFKVPSIVAVTDPKEDTIIDKETGICIPPKSSKALADAIEYFYLNKHEIQRMGESAYRLAKSNFDINKNAKLMLEIYKGLINL